jgi:hypothetical protein
MRGAFSSGQVTPATATSAAAVWRSRPDRAQLGRQGSRTSTPIGSKSATLRVTTRSPCTSAVPAISPSCTGRGSGTWRAALRNATTASTGSVRAAKAETTWPSSQRRRAAPWAGSLLSLRRTPISSSWRLTTEGTDRPGPPTPPRPRRERRPARRGPCEARRRRWCRGGTRECRRARAEPARR